MSGSSSTIKTRSMPDILASHKENDHLCNIRRVIANPLKVLCDKNQFDGARNRSRIFEHVRQKFSKNLFVKIIYDVVIENDLLRQIRIRIHECIKAFFQNLLSGFRHDGQIDKTLE